MNTPHPAPEHLLGPTTNLGASITRAAKASIVLKHISPLPMPGIEHAALPVLFAAHDQPRRVSDLAAACHLDVSTTSRQVSALTALDLVTKQADDRDRRAQVIVITATGRELVIRLREERATRLAQILHDWEPHDIQALSGLLDRYADAVERHLHSQGA